LRLLPRGRTRRYPPGNECNYWGQIFPLQQLPAGSNIHLTNLCRGGYRDASLVAVKRYPCWGEICGRAHARVPAGVLLFVTLYCEPFEFCIRFRDTRTPVRAERGRLLLFHAVLRYLDNRGNGCRAFLVPTDTGGAPGSAATFCFYCSFSDAAAPLPTSRCR